jgi:ABC-type branched-subunit amino acid transport system permease subunit
MGYDNILTPIIDASLQSSGAGFKFSTFNPVVFGLVLILMMRFRPEGFFPSRRAEEDAS